MVNKIKLLGNSINSSFSKNPDHPLFVNFECTYRCNMRCVFCNVWRKNLFPKEATTQEFKKRLLECWKLGCLLASFTGGEPLLRKDIGELLEFSSKRLGLLTAMVTNGILLDEKIDDISNFVDVLYVSFDVNKKTLFNRIRGVNAFDRVKKNVELAKSVGVKISLFPVITADTFKFLDETIDFARSLDIPVHFTAVQNVPREFMEASDSRKMKIRDSDAVIKKLVEEKKKYGKIHFDFNHFKFLRLGGWSKFVGCSAASTTVSLKPDASVSLPCPYFTLATIKKSQNLKEHWNSKKARAVRKECGGWEFCKNCSIRCMYEASIVKRPSLAVKWVKNEIF